MSGTDAATAATTPDQPFVPRAGGPLRSLLGSEVLRVWNRWLYWILAVIAIGVILAASIVAFIYHSKTTGPAGIYGGGKPPYVARDLLAPVGLSVMVGMAVLGFIMGASVGGADWSSRSMALQLLWEPRRLRLLLSKWVGVLVAVLTLTLVAWALAVGLSALTASMRGNWRGMDSQAWRDVWDFSARGAVLVVIAVSLGYALALLVRNTGASLGVAFVYFAVFENVVSMVLAKFDVFRVLFMPNVGSWVTPGGLDLPSGRQDASGSSLMVHISSLQGLSVLLLYVLVLGGAAIWSFTRRDVQ